MFVGVSTILARLPNEELSDGMKKLCSFQINPLSKVGCMTSSVFTRQQSCFIVDKSMINVEQLLSVQMHISIWDSVLGNAPACHLCSVGSNRGQGMWQGSGGLSMLDDFPLVLQFHPPCLTILCQPPHIQECVNKFMKLFV